MRHFSLIRLLAFATPSESFQQTSTAHVALQSAAQQRHATPRVTRKLTSAVKSHSSRVEEEQDDASRRRALSIFAGGSLAFFGASRSNALDMDAFINSELASDTKNCDPKKDPKCKPNLSQDEALCKYGQSGNARAEACKRVKAAGGEVPKPGSQGKSLGGAYAM